MGYTSDWAKEKIHESIWDLCLYVLSLGVGIVFHPMVLFLLSTWFAYKISSYPIGVDKDTDVDTDELDLEPASGAEPPSEPETSLCEAY